MAETVMKMVKRMKVILMTATLDLPSRLGYVSVEKWVDLQTLVALLPVILGPLYFPSPSPPSSPLSNNRLPVCSPLHSSLPPPRTSPVAPSIRSHSSFYSC